MAEIEYSEEIDDVSDEDYEIIRRYQEADAQFQKHPPFLSQFTESTDRVRSWLNDKGIEFNIGKIIAMSEGDNYDFNRSTGCDEFLVQYHAISNKLKKRFLRKPNVSEACDQFSALATQCEQKELWQYAGLCWLAAARCQGTLGNASTEASLLARAGRQFLTAEKKNVMIGCPAPGQENVQAAVSCFGHSLARTQNQPGSSMAAAGLALELATALGSSPAGSQQLRRAISIHATPQSLGMLASTHIKQGDYVTALSVLSELAELVEANVGGGNTATGNNCDILHRCEVSRVLLLLILQPTPQRLAPSLAQLLEKYAWVEESSNAGPGMSEDEMLLLQSLVLACQSQDYQALLELEGELWPYLDTEQKELLRKLVQTLTAR
ncbi:40-kDa huntingtin-associated protein-like [Neodiprion fabricii]|uniref:40-kDa huntingtin-associated protein-like n=1 Tax=Neodiprion fabricii TaxID=2872261 RepID=UPI001ED9359C|nr:40-kDa huntingtin-associated protein-like [Neodiprion fabricii]